MAAPEAGRVLPEALLEQARRFRERGGTPAPPRPAATVVLLRDAPGGPEAYLLRRASTMAFASGMYAFPGGGVDPADADPARSPDWAGPSPAEWSRLLGLPEADARAVLCAAIRETFEEAGVLLAGRPLLDDVSGADWEAQRLALAGHRRALAALLAERALPARGDLLRGWARWITPEFEPRRYDAFFFVAALPDTQLARDVSGEADTTCWLRPADAVAGQQAGELAMLPPTVQMLRSLAGFGSVAEILAVPRRVLTPVLPRVVFGADGAELVLDDSGNGP